MRNSAWARLMTPIMPKITARPRARRISVAIVYRMPNAVAATRSILLRAARPRPGRAGGATQALGLRRVLRGSILVLDQIARPHGIRGRAAADRLSDRKAALFGHLRDAHRAHYVVPLG